MVLNLKLLLITKNEVKESPSLRQKGVVDFANPITGNRLFVTRS